LALGIFFITQFWLFISYLSCSALYHIGKWSMKVGKLFLLLHEYIVQIKYRYHLTEILLQKLDHCGIALFSAGTNTPVSYLLLFRQTGIFNSNRESLFQLISIHIDNSMRGFSPLEKINVLYYYMYLLYISILSVCISIFQYLWTNYGIILALCSWISCFWACWNTFALRPGIVYT